MSTTLLTLGTEDGIPFSLTRFYGGDARGVLCQLSLGGNYIILNSSEMRKIAGVLIKIANYAEKKGED